MQVQGHGRRCSSNPLREQQASGQVQCVVGRLQQVNALSRLLGAGLQAGHRLRDSPDQGRGVLINPSWAQGLRAGKTNARGNVIARAAQRINILEERVHTSCGAGTEYALSKETCSNQFWDAADQECCMGRPCQVPSVLNALPLAASETVSGMATSILAWYHRSCSLLRGHMHQQQVANSCRILLTDSAHNPFLDSGLSRQPCSSPGHASPQIPHPASPQQSGSTSGCALKTQTCSLAGGPAGASQRLMHIANTGHCSQPRQAPAGQCCNTQAQ